MRGVREVSDLPAPLLSADVDLRDFAFMPLDVVRLRDSDLAAEESPEVCWAAVLLWCASWHQVPAGSIPDSDQWQAKQAGYVARGRIDKAWETVRAGALRSWVRCSDGRLYHPVVAEKALTAWAEKQAQRTRTAAATAAREAKRKAEQEARDAQRDQPRDEQRHEQRDVERDVHQGIGRVKGEGIDKSPQAPKGEGRFAEFWTAWPNTGRKQDRKKCLAKWQRCGWDGQADAILAHVTSMKATRQWLDGYEPAPLTYLNGERWRDGVPGVDGAKASDDIFAGAH